METELPVVYRPKRGKTLVYGILALVFGSLGLASQWGKSLVHTASGTTSDAASPALFFSSLLFLSIGLLMLSSVIQGTPRLTIDHDGLVLRHIFWTKAATWDQLGAFTSITTDHGSRREKLLQASAPIIDYSGKSSRKFLITNTFDVPLTTILETIARCHRGVPKGSLAVIHPPVRPAGVSGFRFPWLTVLMLLTFVGVFILEQRLAVTPSTQSLTPSLDTLIAMGGLNRDLVRSGQWFRLFSAPFLHTGLGHLLGNAVAFLLAGYSLERLTGRSWMFLIFIAGALAGSAVSLMISAPSVVSVGASGGIMAMLVALFVISFRIPLGRFRRSAQIQSARIAVPALLPLGRDAAAVQIDYGAHFGGALFGLGVGLLLWRTWRDDSALPRFRTVALVLALVGLLWVGISGLGARSTYIAYAAVQQDRIPLAEYPHTSADVMSRGAQLVATYPRDPVAYFFSAATMLQKSDNPGAERQLRIGLSLAVAEPLRTTPAITNDLRGGLALVLVEEARRSEAEMIVREVCLAKGAAVPAPQIVAELTKAKLCP